MSVRQTDNTNGKLLSVIRSISWQIRSNHNICMNVNSNFDMALNVSNKSGVATCVKSFSLLCFEQNSMDELRFWL